MASSSASSSASSASVSTEVLAGNTGTNVLICVNLLSPRCRAIVKWASENAIEDGNKVYVLYVIPSKTVGIDLGKLSKSKEDSLLKFMPELEKETEFLKQNWDELDLCISHKLFEDRDIGPRICKVISQYKIGKLVMGDGPLKVYVTNHV